LHFSGNAIIDSVYRPTQELAVHGTRPNTDFEKRSLKYRAAKIIMIYPKKLSLNLTNPRDTINQILKNYLLDIEH